MDGEKDIERLQMLRAAFDDNHISKLPKPTKAQNECDISQKRRCAMCGGYHHPDVVHLDYVGHAAITDRLLDVDPLWTWEPLAYRDGLPAFDATGGLWIKLTICGVTRLGYGHAANKTDPGAREKEVIGDALRNAAMRFGAALNLWHKGELHRDEDSEGLLSDKKFKDYAKRIRDQETPEAAKAVWLQAVRECEVIGDVESANMLKKMMIEHGAALQAKMAQVA